MMSKNFFLPALTCAALLLLVALPVTFVILQAIFPHLDSGLFNDAFSAVSRLFKDAQLREMVSATLLAVCCLCDILTPEQCPWRPGDCRASYLAA